jgi:hypothetical protein
MLIKPILVASLSIKICTFITDLKILAVLVTRLLKRDLDRLISGIEPVEL